jgi:hypothetical protein
MPGLTDRRPTIFKPKKAFIILLMNAFFKFSGIEAERARALVFHGLLVRLIGLRILFDL